MGVLMKLLPTFSNQLDLIVFTAGLVLPTWSLTGNACATSSVAWREIIIVEQA